MSDAKADYRSSILRVKISKLRRLKLNKNTEAAKMEGRGKGGCGC